MKNIIVATKNKGKAKDFEAIFHPFGYNVLTLHDVANDMEIEETGNTFEENAVLKAEALAERLQMFVIADDSGLAIDALNGAPGVFSARYAGEAKSDEANMDKVLEELSEVEDKNRTARFCCALALAGPNMETKTVFGSCEGIIAREKIGMNGFGYDPIFFIPTIGKMMAELTPEEKGAISHRGKAIKNIESELPNLLT
ncbi:MAG: XTP/dITP diphosphatase [Paenisporosarcina sp.]